jgi:hypothetical protein
VQIIHRDELYTEKERYVVMTRLTVCEQADLAQMAGHRSKGQKIMYSIRVLGIGKEVDDDQAF